MEYTFEQLLAVGGIIALMEGGAMMMLTYATNMFVALNSPPTKRAAWVVGVPAAIVIITQLFALPFRYLWAAPILPLPGLLIVFWFWRREYRKAWIDNVDDLAEGKRLENADWKVGLITLTGFLVAALITTLIRRSLHH